MNAINKYNKGRSRLELYHQTRMLQLKAVLIFSSESQEGIDIVPLVTEVLNELLYLHLLCSGAPVGKTSLDFHKLLASSA